MNAVNRGLILVLLGGAIGAVMNGCIVRRIAGPQLTGTCDGACAHYIECKPGHHTADRDRCVAECPDVFSDRDSLMLYEGLQCQDAVEYVDGTSTKAAVHRP
jgi:hypothetical protein